MELFEALKYFRENLDLSKKEFNNEIISNSFYHKVENGQNNISADLLLNMLTENDVSFTEFMNKINNGIINFKKSYFDIKKMMYSKDVEGLFRYKNNNELSIGKHIIDGLIQKNDNLVVSKEIQDEIMSYFLRFNGWNEKQVLAYYLSVKILDLHNILKLEAIYSDSIENENFIKVYKKDYYAMKITIIYAACLENKYDIATKYIDFLQNNLDEELFIYEKIMIEFFKNYMLFKEANDTNSEFFKKCQETLTIFDMFDSPFIFDLLNYILYNI